MDITRLFLSLSIYFRLSRSKFNYLFACLCVHCTTYKVFYSYWSIYKFYHCQHSLHLKCETMKIEDCDFF